MQTLYGLDNASLTIKNKTMENIENDVRKGITNAKFNEENSTILFSQITLLSIGLGIYFKSWWVFGGTILGFLIGLNIKPLAVIICILLSVGWGLVGYGIGLLFESNPASIVLAIIGLLSGLGTNFSGLQWVEDIDSDSPSRAE